MIKTLLKSAVSHTALAIEMRAWAYKMRPKGERVAFLDESANVTADVWEKR